MLFTLLIVLILPMLMATAIAGEGGSHIPGTELLGPFPILQFFAALIVLVVIGAAGFVWLKGQKSNEPLSAPRAPEAAIQLFFDGPLKAIFEYLQDIRTRVSGLRMEMRDEFAQLLSSHRATVIREIETSRDDTRREMKDGMDDINDKLKDINDILVRMDERDKNKHK